MATVDLGMTEQQFLESCPRILTAELKRNDTLARRDADELNMRTGLLAAAVYNLRDTVIEIMGGETRSDPWTPHDFFPDLPGQEKEETDVGELMEFVAAMNAKLGGRDLRVEA